MSRKLPRSEPQRDAGDGQAATEKESGNRQTQVDSQQDTKLSGVLSDAQRFAFDPSWLCSSKVSAATKKARRAGQALSWYNGLGDRFVKNDQTELPRTIPELAGIIGVNEKHLQRLNPFDQKGKIRKNPQLPTTPLQQQIAIALREPLSTLVPKDAVYYANACHCLAKADLDTSKERLSELPLAFATFVPLGVFLHLRAMDPSIASPPSGEVLSRIATSIGTPDMDEQLLQQILQSAQWIGLILLKNGDRPAGGGA